MAVWEQASRQSPVGQCASSGVVGVLQAGGSPGLVCEAEAAAIKWVVMCVPEAR